MKLIERIREWISSRRQKSLSTVVRRSLYVSFAIHLLLLLGAAVFVISHVFYNRESTFVGQPPPMKTYEPRKLEFKVKVSKQQRSSSRPSMSPRMVSTKMSSQIALPEIKMDAKVVKTSFQPKFKAFGGTGLGSGLGTGYGLSGFGSGVSAFNFFGIQGRGDRIAILVDVSVSMVEDEEGGIKGYQHVKNRIGQVIDAMSDGAMFNLIVFADAAQTFEKQMVVANDDNKAKAKLFLRPFNTEGNYGLTTGNVEPVNSGVSAEGGETRLDLALTAAFQEGADTILVISDGLPRVKKGMSAAQAQARNTELANWSKAHEEQIRAYDAAPVTQEKVWVPPRAARAPSKGGLKEGQAADNGSPAVEGHWEVRTVHAGGGGRPAPPPVPVQWWNLSDFQQHLKYLYDNFYAKKGKKIPVIHAIGYSIDKEGGAFLKTLTEIYKGRYRRVSRID